MLYRLRLTLPGVSPGDDWTELCAPHRIMWSFLPPHDQSKQHTGALATDWDEATFVLLELQQAWRKDQISYTNLHLLCTSSIIQIITYFVPSINNLMLLLRMGPCVVTAVISIWVHVRPSIWSKKDTALHTSSIWTLLRWCPHNRSAIIGPIDRQPKQRCTRFISKRVVVVVVPTWLLTKPRKMG